MSNRLKRCLTAFALALLMFAAVPQSLAQSVAEPTILRNDAVVDFPHTITFQLEVDAGSPISDAVLTYHIGRDSCLPAGTKVPVEISGSTLEWTWVMSRSGNLPPGAQVWWEWTVTDSSGNIFTTPAQGATFADDRFDWRSIDTAVNGNGGRINLHWYEGEEVGPVLLDAAVAGLDRLQQDAGIELLGDMEIYIYGDSADMREALLYVQEWAGGVAFSDYNTILIGVPPRLADTWGSATVRHEMAHLVLGQFGRSCLGGSRPTWLEEGLAVYAEGEPEDSVLQDIEDGRKNNTFQPVRSLNGAFPAQGGEAGAAYSQSYSLVAFLLDNYGRDKMQELLLTLAAAEGYDAALEQVYGFNADGLESAWRESLGAPVRQIPPTPTPVLAASVPTVVPLDAAKSVPTPDSSGASAANNETSPPAIEQRPESQPPRICAVGLVPLLLFFGLGRTLGLRSGQKKAE